MSEFKSKFDGRQMGHRFKMLQLLHGLAMEINHGIPVKRGVSIVNHTKSIGWMPEGIRMKKAALAELVRQAQAGFGYKPRDGVAKALAKRHTNHGKPRGPKLKVAV